jgi:hypothetical protein
MRPEWLIVAGRRQAVGDCQHGNDVLAVVDGVEGAVVASPGSPDVIKRSL